VALQSTQHGHDVTMEDLQALEVALDERDAADDSARSSLQHLRAHCIMNS